MTTLPASTGRSCLSMCLGAINRGGAAVADLERAMTAILKAFRPGANSWLALVLGRKIDRVLFAATKADHLPASSHERLDAILRQIVDEAIARAETEGAGVSAAGALGLAGNARDDGYARRRDASLSQRHAHQGRAHRQGDVRRRDGSCDLSRRSSGRSGRGTERGSQRRNGIA